MTGVEHNDEFCLDECHRIRTRTNHSGGIQVLLFFRFTIFPFCQDRTASGLWGFYTICLQGGISNGEIINMRVAFKPIATIAVSGFSLTIVLFQGLFC